jgi:anthranilate/para-aminobenzoate synthase component I
MEAVKTALIITVSYNGRTKASLLAGNHHNVLRNSFWPLVLEHYVKSTTAQALRQPVILQNGQFEALARELRVEIRVDSSEQQTKISRHPRDAINRGNIYIWFYIQEFYIQMFLEHMHFFEHFSIENTSPLPT